MLTDVVVTGIGALSAQGTNFQNIWKNVKKGQSGIKKISFADTPGLGSLIGGEIDNFDPSPIISPVDRRKLDDFCAYALFAAHQALEDARIDLSNMNLTRFGVSVGSGIGGLKEIYANVQKSVEKGFDRLSPFFIPKILVNMAAGHISQKFGLKGPNQSIVTACATGGHSIVDACRIIELGQADMMICGGSEAALHPLGIGGFCAAKALSTHFNDEPEKASRPWDKTRDGFVMSDGACLLVIERKDHAIKRGAHMYAQIAGYAATSDAYNITAPDPQGSGAKNAMSLALKHAGIKPQDVGYINAHATSTPLGDISEILAIQSIFDRDTCVSSTKSMTGHLLGAAGSLEAAFSIMALIEGIAPPTINTNDLCDEAKHAHIVLKDAESINTMYALSNSFGFGGANVSILFKKAL